MAFQQRSVGWQLSILRGQRGLNALRAEPAKPVPVLHYNPAHRPITQQREELAAVPVQRRSNLGQDLINRDLISRGPRSHPRLEITSRGRTNTAKQLLMRHLRTTGVMKATCSIDRYVAILIAAVHAVVSDLAHRPAQSTMILAS